MDSRALVSLGMQKMTIIIVLACGVLPGMHLIPLQGKVMFPKFVMRIDLAHTIMRITNRLNFTSEDSASTSTHLPVVGANSGVKPRASNPEFVLQSNVRSLNSATMVPCWTRHTTLVSRDFLGYHVLVKKGYQELYMHMPSTAGSQIS